MNPSLPSTQHAVVVKATGSPDVLQYEESWPVPVPETDQILVRNHVIGLNYLDTYFRSGLYPSRLPLILGSEGAGEVVAVTSGAGNQRFQIGDRVVWMGTAAYAQYSVASMSKVVKLPDGIPEKDAVAVFIAGLTALVMVQDAGAVREGQWVLVLAAAGGVGSLMVQILKLLGAKVIGTASSPEKLEFVKNLGADHVLNYRAREDWPAVVKELTNGEGVDVVFDSVGQDTWKGSLEAVKAKGTVIWYGNSSGLVPPISLDLLSPKCIKIARPSIFGYIQTAEDLERYSQKLFESLASGQIMAQIHETYPLSEMAQAHKVLESRRSAGKVLVLATP